MGFVHLHVHSQYSVLDGTADVDALVKAAAKRGQTALALTDTGNLFGAVAFYKECKKAGIKPIIGAELHVQPEGVAFEDPHRERGGYQLIALVEDQQGYENLCQLVTDGIFAGMQYKPRVDLAGIEKLRAGLIFMSGGVRGVGARALSEGEPDLAEAELLALRAALGENQLYLELQDVGLEGQEAHNAWLREMGERHAILPVVANAVHYVDAEDSAVHEVLHGIALGCSLSDSRRLAVPTDQAYLKTEAEISQVFPDDLAAIARTAELAERCNFKFTFGEYRFPATTPPDAEAEADTDANWAYFYRAFPPPKGYGLPSPDEAIPERPVGAGNINGYFRWYAKKGLEKRLVRVEPALYESYEERLEYELKVIIGMGFPAYLLIVAEFINWSKDQEIPVGPGRGSAAGSLVAWAMRITDIDPIRYKLLFERFLNPERVSMPDIDVDFCQDRREEAITHVRDKYGTELVSQIITYGRLKAKAAVRDVARVLDLSFNEADRLAKLVPDTLGITLQQALDETDALRHLRDGDPKVRRVIDTALRLENNIRQTGVHAAGVVIADQPLVRYAPLYRDGPEGGPVVQYDMKSAEEIGLIKFDFLGLKTLDQIRDALVNIEENYGVKLDMSDVDEDDLPTYQLLQEGDALGVFQLESSGMRELLTKLRPSVIDDMVALVALYRPGPLQSGMVVDFVERKHGRRDVAYPLPMLEPLLKSTYGTIIYQEQVMEIAQVMAGYSLGEADLLRRAMGKKKPEEMEKQKGRFVSGSIANNIHAEKAEEIFELMAKFAAYGFNKSHSAAYGYISYQTAWLKANYRPEYMAALMTIEASNTDKVLEYIQDCRKAGMLIEPVCLNRSKRHFTVPKLADRPLDSEGARVQVIRFGLAAVKGVGDGAIEALLEARAAAGGQFKDVIDLLERIDGRRVNKRVLENLIRAGAMDFSGVPRSALLEGLEGAMSAASRRQADKAAGQVSLFSVMAPAAQPAAFDFPKIPEMPLPERLAGEKDVLGLYLTGHPMSAHGRDLVRFKATPISQLSSRSDGDEVRVLALVANQRQTRTKRGDKMGFVRLEDADGAVECVFFADAYTRSTRALAADEPILVTGKVEVGAEEVKLRANSAEPLSEARARSVSSVLFRLDATELKGKKLDEFEAMLSSLSGPASAELRLRTGNLEARLDLVKYSVAPSVALEAACLRLFGRPDVVELG